MRLKSLLSFILVALSLSYTRAITVEEVPNVHIADRSQYVSNPSGILSAPA